MEARRPCRRAPACRSGARWCRAVTAARSALRARYWRYQRHAHEQREAQRGGAARSAPRRSGSACSAHPRQAFSSRARAQRAQVGVDLGTLRRPREQRRKALGHRHLRARSAARRSRGNLAGCAVATSTQRPRGAPRLAAAAPRPPPRWPCAGTRPGRTARSRCGCARGSAHRSPSTALTAARSSLELREQRAQPLQIARVADVHRRGQRGDARARLPLAARRGSPARCDWRCARARRRRSAAPMRRAHRQAAALPRLPLGTMKEAGSP